MKLITSLIFIFFFNNAGFSADRFWVGGTGNWNNTARWSTTSGGAGGASVPTSIDNTFFDALSFSASGQIVTVNVAANCLDMNWTGATATYTTPTLAGSFALNVYGSLTFIPGMTISYSGDITFKSTSTGKTIASAGQTILGSFIFNGVGGDWTLQDNLTFSGVLNGIDVTNGSFLLNSKTIVPYSITVNGGTFGSSGNNSGITTSGSTGITVSSGTFNAGTGTLNLGLGDISQTGGNFNANSAAISMWDISVSGGTYYWNTSTISMYSSGSLTISGTGTVNTNNQAITCPTINYNGGTFTFGTSVLTVTTFYIGGAITLTTTSNFFVSNYTVNHAGGIIDLGANTTMSGAVTATLGVFNTSNYTLNCGTIVANGGTINLGSSTVVATSTSTVSSGTLNANSSTYSTSSLTVSGGAVNMASCTFTAPYLLVSSGSIDLSTASLSLTGSINNEITLNAAATVTPGTSTITLTGANNMPTIPIHVALGGKTVYNIVLSQGKFPVKFLDGGSLNNLTIPSSSWLIFESTKTFTFNGIASFASTCQTNSLITSSTPGSAAIINFHASQTGLSFLQIRDINNTGTSTSCTTCANASNNSGFTWPGPYIPKSFYWRGTAGTGNWGTGTDWTENADGSAGLNTCVPTMVDDVYFNAASFDATGKIVTIDQRVAVRNIDFTGTISYATKAAITNSGNYDIVIFGDQLLSSNLGTITNSASIFFNGNAAQKITCSTIRLSSGTTYFSNPTTVYLEDDGYFGTVNINAGTLDVQNQAASAVNNLFFSKDWYRTATFTPRSDAAKYTVFNGTSNGNVYDATTFYNLKVNSSAYDLITSADVTVSNELLISGGTYKNTNSKTTLVSGSVNITSALSTSYLYVNSGTFSYLSNSTSGFNLAKGNVWAWGGTINIGVAGSQTTTVLNIGNGVGSGGEAQFDMWSTGSGIVNVADRVLVQSDGLLWVETSGNTLNIKTNTADAGTASTSKFQVNSGGQFKQSGGTINVLGAADNTTPSILFNTASTFTPTNITGGTIVLQSTTNNYDYPVDFGGKTLFNLTVNQASRTFTQTTNSVTLKGSFTISAGTYNANGLIMNVAGTWTNNDAYSHSNGSVTFNGSAAQSIAGANTTTFYTFDLINTSATGLTLNKAAIVNNKLLLRDGYLYASAANTLSMDDNATVHTNSAGSDNLPGSAISFVLGPLKKTGDDAFTFPVGNIQGASQVWAPIEIAAPLVATDAFTAEYKFQSPTTAGYVTWPNPANFGSGLHHVSSIEYWLLAQTAGTSTPAVTLYWKNGSRSGISDLNDITVAHWNTLNSKWENMCSSNIGQGSVSSGSIVSDVVFPNYSPVTFGSKTGPNVLPVELLSFNAVYNNKKVDLTWSTASEINNDYFSIERSADATNFEAIKNQKGAGNSAVKLNYMDIDENPLSGVSYYRLKQVDYNGNESYSRIVSVVINNAVSKINVVVFPNPVSSDLVSIQFYSESTEATVVSLTDVIGDLILTKIIPEKQTSYQLILPLSISNGMYQLSLKNKSETSNFKIVIAR